MCETFKSIKLVVVEVSLANDYQRRKSFTKSVKNEDIWAPRSTLKLRVGQNLVPSLV